MACIAVFAGLRIAGRNTVLRPVCEPAVGGIGSTSLAYFLCYFVVNCAVFLLEFATVQSEKWIFDISPHSCSTCQVLSVCPAIRWPHLPLSEILYTLLSVASAGKQWAEATIKPFGDYSERHRCGF